MLLVKKTSLMISVLNRLEKLMKLKPAAYAVAVMQV